MVVVDAKLKMLRVEGFKYLSSISSSFRFSLKARRICDFYYFLSWAQERDISAWISAKD
jgi:hypothetical protein